MQARALAKFLRPMLDFVPEKRATAAEMLRHDWLAGAADSPSSSGCADMMMNKALQLCLSAGIEFWVMLNVSIGVGTGAKTRRIDTIGGTCWYSKWATHPRPCMLLAFDADVASRAIVNQHTAHSKSQ